MMATNNLEILRRMYRQFNAREMDALLASMHPDVVWANGFEGGSVRGRGGVREYWTKQWATVDPRVEPARFQESDDGVVEVEVHQTVRDLEGNLLMEKTVAHVFRFEDGLILQFEIR